jgi:hypothetical protein
MSEVLVVTKRVKELSEYKQKLIERWQKTANAQVKYYNRKHIALTFKTENLMMLLRFLRLLQCEYRYIRIDQQIDRWFCHHRFYSSI